MMVYSKEMNNPKVSVIMPVYNAAQYLPEAIESILNQTYRDFEFIIINDGSTDNTLDILSHYAIIDSRIKIINQKNSGIVTALNTGLKEAKGEWIFRMDGDDISLPHRFSTQLKVIQENPSLVLLGGGCEQINAEGISLKVNKYPIHHNDLIRALETLKPFFPHPTACFRRDVVVQIGGYRERFRHAEDTDLWLRLTEYGKVACCEDVLIKLRKHTQNISIVQGRLQQLRSFAARICYFRRKHGLSDPSEMEEEVWQDFLEWVEKKMEEAGYFCRLRSWQILRNAWYSNVKAGKVERTKLLLKELIRNPMVMKAFWYRFTKEKLIEILAEQSRGRW